MPVYQYTLWQEDDEITSEKLRQMADNIDLVNSFKIEVIGGIGFGDIPLDPTKMQMQCGISHITLNEVGNGRVYMPVPFPNYITTVVVNNADVAAFDAGTFAPALFKPIATNYFDVHNMGEAPNGLQVLVSWIAFGF